MKCYLTWKDKRKDQNEGGGGKAILRHYRDGQAMTDDVMKYCDVVGTPDGSTTSNRPDQWPISRPHGARE